MEIIARIKIERDDGVKLSNDEHKQSILEQMETEIGNIVLEEIIKNEAKSNEESIGLSVTCEEINEDTAPKRQKAKR